MILLLIIAYLAGVLTPIAFLWALGKYFGWEERRDRRARGKLDLRD